MGCANFALAAGAEMLMRDRISSGETVMKRSGAFFAASLVLFGLTAMGADNQKTEYGSKAEMCGAKVLFIDTGTNLDFRENAIKVLERELPEVKVSDKLDKSVDLILQLNVDSEGDRKGSATMLVIGRSSEAGSVRVLAKYEDSKSSIWTHKLSTVLMRRFVRDYLAANPRH
jgi:hypothetical protein